MIRILLADDHKLLSEAVAGLLDSQEDMQVAGRAATGLEAVMLARRLRPDVVVMDVTMPDLSGVEATERIMAEYPETRILALSMHSDLSFVERMLKAGAVGYLLKSSAASELTSAIRNLAQGRHYLSPAITGPLIERYLAGPSGRESPDQPRLTLREREILQLIAEGLSSKEIADRLKLSVRTVENHRRQIGSRLGIKSVAGLTKYAILHGLTDIEF